MKKRGVSDLIENKKSFAFFGGSSEPSDAEKILTYAINHDMLDLEVVHESMQKKQREEYIKNHKPKIWQTKGRWYTYLPEADGTMKIKSRVDKEKLLDDIAEHYHDLVENPTVKAVFTEWLTESLSWERYRRQRTIAICASTNAIWSSLADARSAVSMRTLSCLSWKNRCQSTI